MNISENKKREKQPKKDKLLDILDDFLFFYEDDLLRVFVIGILMISLFFGTRIAFRYLKDREEYVTNNYVYQLGDIIELDKSSTFSVYNYLDSVSTEGHLLELFVRSDNFVYKISDVNPNTVLFKNDKSAAKLILKSKRLARYSYSSSNKLSSIDYVLKGKLDDRDTLIILMNLDYVGKYIKIKRVD